MTGPEPQEQGRRFHLKARLGAGAFGEVFLAEMESAGGFRRRVALKLLHRDLAGVDEAGRRMRDEARILGRLAHRHIVAVLDLVHLEDRWAVVMDYVPGADLDYVLRSLEDEPSPKDAFPAPAAFEVGAAVLQALHAASTTVDDDDEPLNVVHRDIKPSNVRITSDGDVKVLDFGVARFQLESREAQTRAEGWIGTELYMSPERILAEGDTTAGDVYAAAATIVEMLTGEPLGRTPVLEERHDAFLDEGMKRVRPCLHPRPGEEAAVEEALDVLRSLLAADPHARPAPQPASEQLAALARRLDGEALGPFAQRVVPAAGALAEAGHGTASGTLLERSSAAARTLLLGPVATTEAPPASGTWLIRAGLVMGAGAAIFGLLAVAAAGLGLLGIIEVPEPETPANVMPERPEPEPRPTQEAVAPAPVPTPTPTVDPDPPPAPRVRPAQVRPSPASNAQPSVPKDAPRVGKALFSVPEASSVQVRCGDREVSATSNARVTDFPAGRCVIEATRLGQSYRATVDVTEARTVRCEITEGTFTCS